MSSPKQPESNRPSLWKSMMDSLLGGAAPEAIKPVDDPLDLEGLDLDLLQEIEKKAAPSRPAEVAPRAVARDEEAEQPAPERSKPKVDDDYWNALEGLNWEEEEDAKSKSKAPAAGRSRPASGERRPVEKRSEKRPVETPSASQSRSEEFLDDDDFGAGLSETRPAPAAAPSEETSEGERRGSRRRRGGRGRRGRGERSAPEAAPVEDAIDFDEPEDFAPEAVSEVAGDSDDFGAGLEVTPRRAPSRPEKRPERGSREPSSRGGRRERTEESRPAQKPQESQEAPPPRGRSRREEPEREERQEDEGERRPSRRPRRRPEATLPVDDEVELVDEVVPVEAEEDDDEETAAEREERYRNVPSWEEAISYLIQPKRRSGGSGPRSGDRSRQSRGSNGGNGGGRSSGGRGRSSESR